MRARRQVSALLAPKVRRVVALCGGVQRVSDLTGVLAPTVLSWRYFGAIPERHHAALAAAFPCGLWTLRRMLGVR